MLESDLLTDADRALMHETVIRVSNATLTAIERPGTLASNGDPGTPVMVWTGAAPAFLERSDKDELKGQAETITITDQLIVFDQAGADVAALIAGADWDGSTVVVTDRRLLPVVSVRWVVQGLEHEADGTMDHCLLTLNGGSVVA